VKQHHYYANHSYVTWHQNKTLYGVHYMLLINFRPAISHLGDLAAAGVALE